MIILGFNKIKVINKNIIVNKELINKKMGLIICPTTSLPLFTPIIFSLLFREVCFKYD
jgi:hypothetical protein